MGATKINFLDISVHNRHFTGIQQEIDLTPHSIGYLEFVDPDIDVTVVRFGEAFEERNNFRLYRYNFKDALRLYKLIHAKKNSVALFHGFSFPIHFLIFRLLFGRKVKWIIQHHAGNPSPNSVKRAIQKKAYQLADAFMFVSKLQAKPFIEAGII